MIRVIINADDLGKSKDVNKSIEEALRNDYITSSTILANSEYMEDVKRITKTFNDTKSFGVHLNITEGRSITNNAILREVGMIDADGCFIRANNFESRLYEERVIEAVAQEWDAQVYEILSQGIIVSHIDGHHHCHSWFGYYEALRRVCMKYNITKIRNTYRIPFVSTKERLINKISKWALKLNVVDASNDIKMNRLFASIRCQQDKEHYHEATRAFTKTDYFGDYATICHLTNGDSLNKLFTEETDIELMCHPGHVLYQQEYDYIKDDKLGLKTNAQIDLITYNEL